MDKELKIEIKKVQYTSEEYKKINELRYEVLRKPLNLHLSENDLLYDKDSTIIAGFLNNTLIAGCFLLPIQNNTLKLRQMVVAENMQQKGIGKQLMHFAEEVAKEMKAKKIILHARKTKAGFYEKLGYTPYGDIFLEVGIEHIAMQKNI